MRTVFIKYNPYKVETEIKIDGKDVKKNSALNVGEKRLQEWIEDLPKILVNECNTTDFKISFHGTILDYEDLLSVAGDAKNKGVKIECKHIPAKEVKDKEGSLEEIFKDIQNGPYDELKQLDLIDAFEMAKSKDFHVNVIATMSAGKSTLINALLRKKIMPAKQAACTATITEIKDNDAEFYKAAVYDKNGNLFEVQPELTLPIMQALNSNSEVSLINVEGDIPFVSAEEVSLVLVDTPGPNNARNEEHRKATFRALSESSKPLVLYVLNATQLAVNDDSNLLNNVAESMKVGGKQSKDRFIFVLNKLDEFQPEVDSVKESIEKVKNYLEDKGIKNPNIFPASALTALDIRTILNDFDMQTRMDDVDDSNILGVMINVKKMNKIQDLHLEKYATMTPSIRGEINGMLANAKEAKDSRQEALVHTGIISIESAIRMYVDKYAKTAKIKNIVDTFDKKLESAKSFENIKQEIAANKDKQKEIIARIDSINEKLKSGEEAAKFIEKIKEINYHDEINSLADDVVQKAQNEITKIQTANTRTFTKQEAMSKCEEFKKLAGELKIEVTVKLENLLNSYMKKNAEELFEQYKQKISGLINEGENGSISIDPFELIAGNFQTLVNISQIVSNATTVEKVKIDEIKHYHEFLGIRRWLNSNLGTIFDVEYDVEEIFEDREYVDGDKLVVSFFSPIETSLYSVRNDAVEYSKKQSDDIKQAFVARFEELDEVLKEKLSKLDDYAKSSDDIKKTIDETTARLEWLKRIQGRIQAILEI